MGKILLKKVVMGTCRGDDGGYKYMVVLLNFI